MRAYTIVNKQPVSPFFQGSPRTPPGATILPALSFLLEPRAPVPLPFYSRKLTRRPFAHANEGEKSVRPSNGYGVAREYCPCKSPYRSTNGGSFIIIADVPTDAGIVGLFYPRVVPSSSSSLFPVTRLFPSSVVLVSTPICQPAFTEGTTSKERVVPVRGDSLSPRFSVPPVIVNREREFLGPSRAISSLRAASNWKNCATQLKKRGEYSRGIARLIRR